MTNMDYDAIVVGSGFGGSVMTYRLAAVGQRVCLFNLWSFQGVGAIVSSGLGGGSLIYANVLLRKDAKWLVTEYPATGTTQDWPLIRTDLDPHYGRMEQMLAPQVYPLDQPPYCGTGESTRPTYESATFFPLRCICTTRLSTLAGKGWGCRTTVVAWE